MPSAAQTERSSPFAIGDCARAALREAARCEDRTGTLARSSAILRELGWFVAALPGASGGSDLGRGGRHAKQSVDRMIALTEVNLSLARVFEGHVNAVGLVAHYADDAVRQMLADAVEADAIVGVWGADGADPVRYDPATRRLTGGKRYASGLGILTHALITVATEEGQQLALADVSDPARADGGAWQMAGMRASASGSYDFGGMGHDRVAFVGPANVFTREPHFLGGVWRIATLTLGATFGLIEASREALGARDRLDHPAQIGRLGPLVWQGLALREMVTRTSAFVEGPEGTADPERAAAAAIGCRLMAEDLGQSAIAAVERSIGLPHFEAASETGRIARDLATYMRQAAGDALAQRAGREALMSPTRLAELLP